MNRIAVPIILVAFLSACSGSDDYDITSKIACTANELNGNPSGSNPAPQVVPGLQSWHGGNGNWSVSTNSRIVLEPAYSALLQPLATRLAADIAELTGLKLAIATGASVDQSDIALSLSVCNPATATKIGDEGYTLDIGKGATLRANINSDSGSNKTNGLFYGTRTLLQMLALDGKADGSHQSVAQGYVVDYPLYKERVILMDVGRAFINKESLKAYMKFMGWYKLNTLHFSISGVLLDRTPNTGTGGKPGFRLYSNNSDFKFLQPLSYDGLYYSKNDWDELEDAAAANGIALVPEFNTPGHAMSMVNALVASDPSNQSMGEDLDTTDPKTLAYVTRVWDEFLPWFRSNKVHIGGDEGGNSAPIQAFINNVAKYLQSKGKTVNMWNDTVIGDSIYDPNIVIHNWIEDISWNSPKFPWINSSGSFYVAPNSAPYEESAGFAGDSFYADDSALNIQHPEGDEKWDWFANTKKSMGTHTDYAPLGGQLSLWNDMLFHNRFTFEGLSHTLISDALPAAGQIWWNGQKQDSAGSLIPYSELRKTVASLQFGPGVSDIAMFKEVPLSATTPRFEKLPQYVLTPPYLAQLAELGGGARKSACASCGGGEVTALGNGDGSTNGTLTFSVPVTAAGVYMLPIYYVSADPKASGQIAINGGAATQLQFPPTGGSAVDNPPTPTELPAKDQQVIFATFVTLQAGMNTIRFSNPTAWMPNIGGLGVPLLQPAQ